MNWYLLLFYPQGIKVLGPFKEETEAFDLAMALQAEGVSYYFETYPSSSPDARDALREWHKEEYGKELEGEIREGPGEV